MSQAHLGHLTINGGNHAQFVDYGSQSGDNVATIPLEQQITQTIEQTLELIESVGSR